MDTINEIINFMIKASIAGLTMRFIYCMLKMITSDDGQSYKKRAMNTVVYAVIAVSIFSIRALIESYFG